jgi:RNA polymerase sigma-70 factor (ECF subfamily)
LLRKRPAAWTWRITLAYDPHSPPTFIWLQCHAKDSRISLPHNGDVTFGEIPAKSSFEGFGLIAAEAELRALMVRSLAGDGAAYATLLRRLNGHLRAYYLRRLGPGRAADAEDLLQETLIAMHARRSTYDTSRPFTAWVFSIARYKLIDHFRRTKRRAEEPLDDLDQFFSVSDSNAVEAQIDVERLLQRLPQKSRRLVQDVKIRGLSTTEAAEQNRISESAVKVGVHRALKSLGAGVKDEES